MGDRVVVVGAGIGGLAAALALARTGREVVVVERDDTPMPDDVEGAFGWDRRGAPQVRHTHGFPALVRVLLRDRFPDVLRALRDAGVEEIGIMPPSVPRDAPGYERDAEDLQVLGCRRTTFEWVLRRCVLAEPGVTMRVGVGVDGLLARPGAEATAPLRVRGVRLADGTEVAADLVVASTGRRDAVPAWFLAHGVEVPEEEHPTGTIYLSRFYRGGADPPTGFRGGRRAGVGFVVAGADHGTYSATIAVDAADAELRAHLLDPDRFQAALPLFRELEPVARAGGTPITPVQAMGGLVNRIRRFTGPDGAPLAHRFFAVGDAHTCTNPLYGRGSSLAVLQAVLCADAVTARPHDPDAAARDYEAASAERVEPWYHVALLTDRAAARPPGAEGAATDADTSADTDAATSARDGRDRGAHARPDAAPPRLDLATMRAVMASGDPELAVLVARTMSLLATPQEVFGDPDVLRRIADATAAARPSERSGPTRPPLTRADLLAAGR